MKGYKSISNNIKTPGNKQSNHKGAGNSSSYHRSDKSLKEQKSELIKKYLK